MPSLLCQQVGGGGRTAEEKWPPVQMFFTAVLMRPQAPACRQHECGAITICHSVASSVCQGKSRCNYDGSASQPCASSAATSAPACTSVSLSPQHVGGLEISSYLQLDPAAVCGAGVTPAAVAPAWPGEAGAMGPAATGGGGPAGAAAATPAAS